MTVPQKYVYSTGWILVKMHKYVAIRRLSLPFGAPGLRSLPSHQLSTRLLQLSGALQAPSCIHLAGLLISVTQGSLPRLSGDSFAR